MVPRAAYVHIPFCRRRCFYCDFAISVVGDRKRGDTSPTISRYVDTLITEVQNTPLASTSLASTPAKSTQAQLLPEPLATVFFGGGTPSLLCADQLERILSVIRQRFGLSPQAEISMEMDPATFDLSHASGYRAVGVNRVSLGVQAFQDELLAAAGRFHRRSDIFQAVDVLRSAGFANISLDLMSGLPHQTMAHWHESLQAAIALNPTHLSVYDLIVEPQTAFARYFTPGQAPLPSDEATAAMYKIARDTLVACGYGHYEICNYAKPGYEAQHNITYWRCEPNYGFGMGATSYLPQATGPQRIDRPRTQSSYRQWVDQLVAQGGSSDAPVLPPSEQVLETVMMGLRLKPGILLDSVYQLYGEPGLAQIARAIAPHVHTGWVVVESADPVSDSVSISNQAIKLTSSSRLRLSDPEGFLMSNVVITDVFNALETVSLR